MFKALLELIFPSLKNETNPNFFAFEDGRNKKTEAKEARPTTVPSNQAAPLLTAMEKQQKGFYDYLFGENPATREHDELSKHIEAKILHLFKQPDKLTSSLPVLPSSLAKVIETINDDDFDTQELVSLIRNEPVIAAKVIELANSTYYRRGEKEVTDLKSAFMNLGSQGLVEGVINGFVSKFTPQSNVYFRQFGHNIWGHSLATGVIARSIAEETGNSQLKAEAYLVGLICNLGDMIIFHLLIESFAHVHPDAQPNSFAFKSVMMKYSKKLTVHIAKHWKLPRRIIEALVVQYKTDNISILRNQYKVRPVAALVFEANVLSELELQCGDDPLQKEHWRVTAKSWLASDAAMFHLQTALDSAMAEA